MQSVRITEPHPSLPSSHRLHTGRGGAGNVKRVDFTKPPSASTTANTTNTATKAYPASLLPLGLDDYSPPPRKASVASVTHMGRGGAGNVTTERALFSFDEELERQQRMEDARAPVYHVGRGGAGNMVHSDWEERTPSSSSMHHQQGRKGSMAESVGSGDSGASDLAYRARRSLERGWDRIVRH